MQPVVDAGSGGWREAKKMATRRQLSSAARRMATEQGMDAVTVEAVCRDVGVSVRTFFNYFESKDAAIAGTGFPVGSDDAIALFVGGGPSGNLLNDLLVLMDPSGIIEAEGREELRRTFALAAQEPRILALKFEGAAGRDQERSRLIAQRLGLREPDGICRTASAVAQALLYRACREWCADDSGIDLRSALTRVRRELDELSRTPEP